MAAGLARGEAKTNCGAKDHAITRGVGAKPEGEEHDRRAFDELLDETNLEQAAVLDAPRHLVFEATTRPEHLKRWWGPRRTTMTLCEIDLRPGGAWRYVLRDQESGREDGFSGVYREITPPERLVYTEGWEGLPGHDYLVTATLEEKDGKTTITSRLQYKSVEDRDGHVNSGMEGGMRETYDRLGEHLAAIG